MLIPRGGLPVAIRKRSLHESFPSSTLRVADSDGRVHRLEDVNALTMNQLNGFANVLNPKQFAVQFGPRLNVYAYHSTASRCPRKF